MRLLSSAIIIAQSDTRNTEYLISWLQKLSLEQLLLRQGTFFRASSFKVCLFYKSLLSFLTFVICEVFLPCREISRQHLSMFDIVFAQLGVIPRTRNKFLKIVAVAERYFIIAHVKKIIKEAAVPNMLFCKIS